YDPRQVLFHYTLQLSTLKADGLHAITEQTDRNFDVAILSMAVQKSLLWWTVGRCLL
ncbi:uncharacterized protein FOMMEDRAFT_20057, partial [Fomitiporia mediterranea MF3/22]|uniref:uncharacterized protein n=1 Tax=Fomitiporia mediterranea (strain MF3/22) TaxID=694068 RepID=UPI000440854A